MTRTDYLLTTDGHIQEQDKTSLSGASPNIHMTQAAMLRKLNGHRARLASVIFGLIAALSPTAKAQGPLQRVQGYTFTGNYSVTTTAGSAALFDVNGASACFVNITGTWTGTISFYGSNGGLSGSTLDIYIMEGWGQVFRARYPSTTTNGDWHFQVAGFKYIVLAGPTNSGTANVKWSCGPGMAVMYVDASPDSIQNVAITTADATVTQSSSTPAIYLQGQKQLDYFIIWVGITGSPVGCKVTFKGSGDTVNYVAVASGTIAISPSTTGSVAASVTTIPMGVALTATYSCDTTYPTGGTITVEFVVK